MTSAASDIAGSRPSDDVDRNLALLSYGLLFFAVFCFGIPALIAVAIAYACRREADPAVRSHFRFQIFVFWVSFALTVIAAVAGVAALLTLLGAAIGGAVGGRWDGLDSALFSQTHIGIMVVLVAISGFAALLAAIWLMITSAYGFIRLASRQSFRQTAR